MVRIEHAAIAVILFVAFVADLRFLVPAVLGVLAVWAVLHAGDRVIATIGVVGLAISTLSFATGNEVAAWAAALAVAVLAGVSAAGPRARVRQTP